MKKNRNFPLKSHPGFLLVLSFVGAIFIGALLLMLPIARTQPLSFIDALFTTTSATCVTGLLTINVAETFTFFGQAVLLVLIQFGGMGVMTASTLFALMLGKSVSMKGSSIVHSEFTVSHKIDIRKLVKWMVMLIFSFEAVGAVIFFISWADDLGLGGAVWPSIFHAVSAFCNAGISIFPDGPVWMKYNPIVDINFMILMNFGAMGFVALIEGYEWAKKRRASKYTFSLHTRVVAISTTLLILVGVAGYMVFEADNVIREMSFSHKLVSAFFHSISGRTAGFLNVDFGQLENSTLYMFMFFMFIGGAPGSTAGGIKLTTFAILVATVFSRYRGTERVHILNHAIPEELISRAISIFLVLSSVLLLFLFLIFIVEPAGSLSAEQSHGSFLPLLFEAVSAFGTVGSSMGITPSLSVAGKTLIMLLMLFGRLAGIVLVITMGVAIRPRSFQLSEESIMIG
jgi:trk system potassium uptake protein TrkH